MMSRKAESNSWGFLIAMILGFIVVFGVVLWIMMFGGKQIIKDLIFEYTPEEDDFELDEDYSGNTLMNPDKLIFRFHDGIPKTDIDYNCKGKTWFWSYDNEEEWDKKHWFSVKETTVNDFQEGYFTENTWILISKLKVSSCEEGVILIAERTTANDESVYGWSVVLEFFIEGTSKWVLNKPTRTFEPGDDILKSPNAFIKRLNRLTEILG